jgi:hypothetical protein
MAQNYTRQSSFADGDTITASLFNNEFNQVVNAFSYSASSDSSTGHKHDGTAGQGGNIPKIGDIDFLNKIVVDSTNNRWGIFVEVAGGPVEQVRIQDGGIVPVTTNDIDLGTASLQFKDIFIDGTANIDSLVLSSGSTVTAILDEDDLVSDSATALATQQSIKAYVDAQVTAQDLDIVGDTGTDAIDLDSETLTFTGGTGITSVVTAGTVTHNIDSTVATLTGTQTLTNKTITSPDIDGGTVDGADITVGAAKTLDVSAGTLTLADNQISGDKVEGGTIAAITITAMTGTLQTAAQPNVTSLGTIASLVATTADINGGTIDGTVIGGTTAAAGSFTTGSFSETTFVGLTARPAGVPATAGRLWAAQNETGNYGIASKASTTDSFTYIGNTGTKATLGQSYGSTGSYLPLVLQTSDLDRLTISAAGAATFSSTVAGAFNGTLGATTPASVAATTLSTTGDISLPDNAKAIFGAGSDLQIYHDGSNSYIKDQGTGNLNIQTNGVGVVIADTSASDLAVFNAGSGQVTLYNSGSAKLATTATGIDVTGTVTADGLTVDGNVSIDGGTIKLDGNYPVGAGNVALGNTAFNSVTTGAQNVSIGNEAGYGITSGSSNTAVGTATLFANDTGSNNVAVGRDALGANTTASNNTAVGYQAGYTNTTGTQNTYSGYWAGYLTTGSTNSFFGYGAGSSVTTGGKNTIIGAYNGNQGGLDIRTASNHIVLSDGDGNPRAYWDAAGALTTTGAATFGGTLSSGGITTTGNTSAAAASAGDGRLFPNNAYGAFVYGNGTTYDVALGQRSTGVALGVPAGTTNVVIPTGSVGIGTSSPTAPLTVNGGTASAATIQLGNHNDNASIHGKYSLSFKADSTEAIADRSISFAIGTAANFALTTSTAIFNDLGADIDFRVESDSNTHALFVDAGNSYVNLNSSATPDSSVAGFMFTADQLFTSAGAATTLNYQVRFYNGNGLVGAITTDGSATAYLTSSDQRLKENIADAPDAGDLIDAIQVRQFDWKADGEHQRYGMVAQELNAVAPEAVSAPEDPDEMMGVDYSKLVPMMLKEIQSLRARISQLEGAN